MATFSKAGYTPGPWEMNRYGQIVARGEALQVCGVSLPCGYVPDDHIGWANARLVAAAPELLEVVKDLCGQWERQKGLFPVLARDEWMDLAIGKARILVDRIEARSV